MRFDNLGFFPNNRHDLYGMPVFYMFQTEASDYHRRCLLFISIRRFPQCLCAECGKALQQDFNIYFKGVLERF
jgi:hypothetical protein